MDITTLDKANTLAKEMQKAENMIYALTADTSNSVRAKTIENDRPIYHECAFSKGDELHTIILKYFNDKYDAQLEEFNKL